MFKWVLGIALIASIAFCAAMEYRSQQTLAFYRSEIAAKRAELVPLQPIVSEVETYQTKKEALQRRIDRINRLKQQQRGPVTALTKLADVDPNGVESIAVVNKELVVNRR
jgi:Tfp pilus assembly protein PilN